MVKVIATVCLLCAASVSHAVHVSSVQDVDAHVKDLDNDNLYHIRKIFTEYGDGESISVEGFLRMLNVGKLQQVTNNNESSSKTKNKTGTALIADQSTKVQNGLKIECIREAELLTTNNATNSSVTVNTFHEYCPVLLYSFVAKSQYEQDNGCIFVPTLPELSPNNKGREVSLKVWLCAVASVIIVSLCGLLGVAVIPFMEHKFYQQMLQFLVALAIGTLCGDALLHLLPHAIAGEHDDDETEHHSEHDHHSEDMVLKGLVAVLGIILFFFTEKFLTVVAEYYKRRQKKREAPPTVRVVQDCEGIHAPSVGEKLCKHKYSSSPYCYDEITEMSEAHKKMNMPDNVSKKNRDLNLNQNNHCHTYGEDDEEEEEEEEFDQQMSTVNCSGEVALRPSTSNASNEAVNRDTQLTSHNKDDEKYIVIIREHQNSHHGHSHTHGHVHSPPKTMSSVVWMVVMGDGLHNFTDGVAIGAAFAANIGGGFSTAIAVFCHELPHELGDFAVLLKAGMSPKQAVFYNLLSSILCLFGMVIGLVLGQNSSATSWVFALAGGLFLYIGLVDMIPELTSGHSKEGGSLCQCLLQFLGLLVGVGIMLLIALYEHDIKTVFRT